MASASSSIPTALVFDGVPVHGHSTFDVINPATGEVFAQAPAASPQQLDRAFQAAARAFRSWRRDEDARREAMRRAADAMEAAIDEMAPVLTAEQGKPLADARFELGGAVAWMRYYADLEVPREIVSDDESMLVEVVRRPIGPVAAIAPWNFPVSLALWKLGPALRAGNTVVLKPSPYTPLTSLMLGNLLRSVLPAGVFNVVSGGDELGALMSGHPLARKVSFTGSIETGKKVALSAAGDLKRVTLELGGNDAAIVLDDADPAAIAEDLFASAFANNGQVCAAIKRVYVPESLERELVDALAARAEATRVGDGMDAASQLGPINNRPQFERVDELVADAVVAGGTAAAGGRRLDGDGYFYAPTIISGVSDGTRIVDEEQFGPALPVIAYSDLDVAVARANGSMFALGSSVWSGDADRAADVAARIEAGTTGINTHVAVAPNLPFGGVKWSGIGVENGPWGLLAFTDMQVIQRRK